MSKKKALKINIPEPCSESWDEMAPGSCGRFCAACQKTVTDFTVMSDMEILAVLQGNTTTLCGRFLPEQLNRTMGVPEPVSGIPFWQKIAVAVIIFQAFTLESFAQQKKKPSTETHADKRTKQQQRILKGKLLDFETKQPVGGIHLLLIINGYDTLTAQTGKNGHFTIQIPSHYVFDTARLHPADTMFIPMELYIPDEYVSEKQLAHEVTMYRYLTAMLPDAGIAIQQPVITIRTETHTMGAVMQDDISKIIAIRKPTLWRHITQPFRRKKHH